MSAPIVTVDIQPVILVKATWPDGRKVLFTYEATPECVKELDAKVDATDSMQRAGGSEPGWQLYAPADDIVPLDILEYLRGVVRGKIEQMVEDAKADLGIVGPQTRTQRN